MRPVPRGPAAALSALRFSAGSGAALEGLGENDWATLLKFGDRTQLTLPLNARYGHIFPSDVRSEIDRRAASQQLRVESLKRTFLEIDALLRNRGIEHTVLKGFTHCPDFIPALHDRMQYDIDLYTPLQYREAWDAVRGVGYEPIQELSKFPLDHLPTLIRKTGWQWRDDFYDPDLPLSIEIHFRLWDRETERLSPEGLEEFRDRCVWREEHGLRFLSLHPADRLGYAALHLLRHVLRGDLKPLHLYEHAHFVHTHSADEAFWRTWSDLHQTSLQQLEALCFALAVRSFACDVPEIVAERIAALPDPVTAWLQRHGDSPLTSLFHPNKDELWLHLSLLRSGADRRAVFLRRMFPMRMPGPVDAVHLPKERITWRIHIRKRWRYGVFISQRLLRHARALPQVVRNGLKWWLEDYGIAPQFLRFLAAAAVYELGLFVFYLLYNLYLLDIGFAEDFVGANAAAMQAGGIAGAIPAGLAGQKWGLRRVLTFSLAALAVISALRTTITGSASLLVLAFAAGMFASCWMICFAPAISELTAPENRPFAFSLFFALGIGVGVLGGILGGYLPAWTIAIGGAGKRPALLIGCALVGVAALMMHRLPLRSSVGEVRVYRGAPAVWRFLLLIGLFSAGTGAFNPLYTVFLSTVGGLEVQQIGTVFAISQFAQVLAVIAGGAAVRRFGFTSAIGWMFAGTGAALCMLAGAPAGLLAGSAYVLYMCFQYTSTPGISSLLMSLAPPVDRQGAAALQFLVVNGAQAAAALLAGLAVARFGYGPVLGAAAGVVLVAALLFAPWMRSSMHSR